MRYRFEQWRQFLSIDSDSTALLRKYAPAFAVHIDSIMDAVYAHIDPDDEANSLFKTPKSKARARQKQKEHWLEHVFVGRFDEHYIDATKFIGTVHQSLGVDLRMFTGAYAVALNELSDIVVNLPIDAAEKSRLMKAIQRAVFLDMGIITDVYYETVISKTEALARELNLSLARAGEYRDNETGQHLMRISRMSAALAAAAGMSVEWISMIRLASPLHNVGKIGVPDKVLLKPGQLDDTELSVMRMHPEIGGKIIPEYPTELTGMARRISLTHHEKWDGSGYPAGLRGEEIPLEGRIVAICDVYDALISKRPYKKPWTKEAVVRYLKDHSGSHFDPRLTAIFLSILPIIDEIQEEFKEESEATAAHGATT